MTEANATRGSNPPYISRNVWKPFFERMQRIKRPQTLTIQTLKDYGFGQEPALASGLKFLGLVDDEGSTTDRFKLIQVQGEQFQKNLSEIILSAYHDLLAKHSLDHATYDDIVNYFSQKYSPASATKMAKSFAVLCQLAGIDSPAFSKMRSLEATERQPRPSSVKQGTPGRNDDGGKPPGAIPPQSRNEDLVREFIKTNPMPTGVQWDVTTLKAYFEEYRATLDLLRGEKKTENE